MSRINLCVFVLVHKSGEKREVGEIIEKEAVGAKGMVNLSHTYIHLLTG